jgi:ATP-dependent DNA helicase 2 subunit 1
LSHFHKPFYTAEELRAFRTLGLETGVIPAFTTFYTSDIPQGIWLLGFKDQSELLFEDNIKHSTFIYPDEDVSPS